MSAVAAWQPSPASRQVDAELESVLALMERDDPLALEARARARDGELTYTAAWAWLREQEGETA